MSNQPDPATDRSDLPPQLPLATCPWCRQPAVLDTCLHHGYYAYCENPACLVLSETRPFDTAEQAAAAWNARA